MPISSLLGVNLGGIASGLLFRKYLNGLDHYLKKKCWRMYQWNNYSPFTFGWWLDSLFQYWTKNPKTTRWPKIFCNNDKIIVKETKTKVMNFVKKCCSNVYFNGKRIEQVTESTYLGNIIRAVQTDRKDVFNSNYTYLCDRANRALFLPLRKLRNIDRPSPKILFNIFETLKMPILAYGSDVWGARKDGLWALDKIFLRFVRWTLGTKTTTSNIIVAGECGRLPPSTQCTIVLH